MNAPTAGKRAITRDVYSILVALADGWKSGSEVQAQVIADTVGDYIRTSSLYAALHRLERYGWVQSLNNGYELTDKGWHALTVETRSLESLVQAAKHRVVSSGHGRW